MMTKNKRLIGIVLTVGILLLIPLIAKFPWSGEDFVIAGILLLGTGLLCEFVLRKVNSKGSEIALCVAILIGLFLVWAELAVGLFGTRFAGS